jgi:hypothetical protein
MLFAPSKHQEPLPSRTFVHGAIQASPPTGMFLKKHAKIDALTRLDAALTVCQTAAQQHEDQHVYGETIEPVPD